MALLEVGALPEEALAASAAFHADILPKVMKELSGAPAHLTLLFQPAGEDHRGWRLAAVQGLARRFAPVRVNALESGDDAAIAAAESYLAKAAGVTGQFLPLDSNGAGEVLYTEK